MKESKILEKAAQQALSECLGYDEGRAYYLILTKQEKELEKEFSYSKKYRLMKSLFELGAMGKIKPENQDFFSYFLLPPSFLYFKKIEIGLIEFLEGIYLNNFRQIFDNRFSQITLKDERFIIIFLLKYFMKEDARLIADMKEFYCMLGNKKGKINFTNSGDGRRMGVIDKDRAFNFVDIRGANAVEYVGYIARDRDEKEKYVPRVEEAMRRAF